MQNVQETKGVSSDQEQSKTPKDLVIELKELFIEKIQSKLQLVKDNNCKLGNSPISEEYINRLSNLYNNILKQLKTLQPTNHKSKDSQVLQLSSELLSQEQDFVLLYEYLTPFKQKLEAFNLNLQKISDTTNIHKTKEVYKNLNLDGTVAELVKATFYSFFGNNERKMELENRLPEAKNALLEITTILDIQAFIQFINKHVGRLDDCIVNTNKCRITINKLQRNQVTKNKTIIEIQSMEKEINKSLLKITSLLTESVQTFKNQSNEENKEIIFKHFIDVMHENKKLQNENRQLEEQAKEAKEQIKILENKLESAISLIAENNAIIEKQNQEIKEKDKRIEEQNKKIESLLEKLKKLIERDDQQAQKIKDYEEKIKNYERRIDKLNNEMQSFEEQFDEVQNKLKQQCEAFIWSHGTIEGIEDEGDILYRRDDDIVSEEMQGYQNQIDEQDEQDEQDPEFLTIAANQENEDSNNRANAHINKNPEDEPKSLKDRFFEKNIKSSQNSPLSTADSVSADSASDEEQNTEPNNYCKGNSVQQGS